MIASNFESIMLSVDDMRTCLACAQDRLMQSLHKGLKDRLWEKPWVEAFVPHLYGAMGELAVAKALNIFPALHTNEFSGGKSDLIYKGYLLEVRHRKLAKHDLIVRPGDPNERLYVLTTGDGPEVLIHGFSPGSKAKQEKFKKNWGGHGEAYFVPSYELFPLSNLIHTEIQDVLQ